MEMATPYLAKQINNLTYKIYKLEGKKNSHMLVPYEAALGLTYEIASDMVKELKEEIKRIEYKNLYSDNLSIGYKLRYQPSIKRHLNYIKPIYAKADLIKMTLLIKTSTNNIIEMDLTKSKKLVNADMECGIKGFFDVIKRAIDEDSRINIYRNSTTTFIHKEDARLDQEIEHYSSILNKILEITNNQMPILWNEKEGSVKFHIADTLELLEVRDKKLYDFIAPNLGYRFNQGYLHKVALNAKNNLYGLTYKDNKDIEQIK